MTSQKNISFLPTGHDIKEGTELSIIIVSWNTRQLLAQCLTTVHENLATLPHLDVETYVVDNASADESTQMVQADFPWVRLIANQENVGFARANNQAIRQATAGYVLLLNPDTELKPGSLATLLEFMAQHPQAGAVGPYLLNPDGSLQISCYPAPTPWREFWRLFHLDALWPYFSYRQERWSTKEPREVDVIKGACLMVRHDALKQVGLLDEGFFIYAEEVDLCRRLIVAGWHLYWLPESKVLHYGGQSTKQVAADMFLRLYETKVLYFRKHYGRLGARVYKLILLAATLTRLLITPLAWFEQGPQRQEHLKLANNYLLLAQKIAFF